MPFAFADLDLFDKNIADIALRCGTKNVRVASKSVRCVHLLRRILAHGRPYKGIMAYSPSEAVFLAREGFDDILLGYPCFHAADIRAVLEVVASGKTIRFMADDPEQVRQISRVAVAMQVQAEYCLDIDMSTDFPGLHFGVYRSPLHTVYDVQRIYPELAALPDVRLAGIMGYEAQIAGVGDNVAGGGLKNNVIRFLKGRSVKDLSHRREAVVRWLQEQGAAMTIINAGGTGSLETSSAEPWITEVTVGSGFYSPGLFDSYKGFRHLPAAGFAVEIVRRPKSNIYTCLGGGYIASGEIGTAKQPRPYLPEGFSLIPLEGCGEVQTPVIYKGPEQLGIGDPVFFRHAKAGELFERFSTVCLVKEGKIVDEVNTYRGDGECFV